MKKYLDFWSLNHTLAGCILAGIFLFINTPFSNSIIFTFLILISWEFFELLYGVYETIQNRTSDMIVGLSGFFITHYLIIHNVFNNTTLFAIIFLIFLILEIWGFWAYEKVKK